MSRIMALAFDDNAFLSVDPLLCVAALRWLSQHSLSHHKDSASNDQNLHALNTLLSLFDKWLDVEHLTCVQV